MLAARLPQAVVKIKTMKTEIDKQIDDLEYELQDIKRSWPNCAASVRAKRCRITIAGFEGREATLSSLFGDRGGLIVVHNMGRDCSYCTMWADGFTGLLPHLESRAAFVRHVARRA